MAVGPTDPRNIYPLPDELQKLLIEDAISFEAEHPTLQPVGLLIEPGVPDPAGIRASIEKQVGRDLANTGFIGVAPRQIVLDLMRAGAPELLDWIQPASPPVPDQPRRLPSLVLSADGYRLGPVLVYQPGVDWSRFEQQMESQHALDRRGPELQRRAREQLARDPLAEPAGLIALPDTDLARQLRAALPPSELGPPGEEVCVLTTLTSMRDLVRVHAPHLMLWLDRVTHDHALPILCVTKSAVRAAAVPLAEG
jgi:hypothetical protein